MAEFTRPVSVAALGTRGETVALDATEAERAALARRLGVEHVERLGAQLSVVPTAGGAVRVTGRVTARLGRLCVVSLAPLVEEIDEALAIRFVPEAAIGRELSLEAEGEDEEPYAGGTIDLGEAVAQTVALVLDPWPRAPGAVLPAEASREP